MRTRHWSLLAAIISLLCLCAGCDAARNVGRSPEDRINEAYPISVEVGQALEKLTMMFDKDEKGKEALVAEVAAKQKIRALSCAAGYAPSLFQSVKTIREHLVNADCFREFDKTTIDWLNAKSLALLLTSSPLRAAPQDPPTIFATTFQVNTIKFADEAAIALATSNNSVEVIDVGTGESLFLDKALKGHPSFIALSPNGQVFAVSNQDGIVLRGAAAGEVLREFPDYQRLTWVSATRAVAVKRDNRGAELFDFVANKGVVLKGVTNGPTRIIRLRDAKDSFVVAGYTSIHKFELPHDSSGTQPTLVAQVTGPPMSWSDNVADVTIDGKYFVQASNDLWVTDLESLQSEQLQLKPFYARAATPMPDPGEVLLQGALTSESSSLAKTYVYSIADKMFTAIDDEQLAAPNGYTAVRTVYIPALKRVAVVSGSTVKLISDFNRGFKYGIQALPFQLQNEQKEQQDKVAAATAARLGYRSESNVNGLPVMSGPVLELAKDAQIEAVGVYESARGSHGAGQPSQAGPVSVFVKRSTSPIILVLSSYEPVSWQVTVDPRASLKAVLLSSYGDSVVTGVGSVRVTQLGRMYAYERGSQQFVALQREVTRLTGKTIDTFQGKYTGSAFIVGGL